jgi:hypothetical protein
MTDAIIPFIAAIWGYIPMITVAASLFGAVGVGTLVLWLKKRRTTAGDAIELTETHGASAA